MKPKISIMIPTYNSAAYINQAINSVFDQELENYELIIVDNASTDATFEIIQSIKSDRIKYFKNSKNIGAVGNLNKCLEYATGEYLHFLCSDDALLKKTIVKQIDILDSYESVGLVTCDMIITDENLQNGIRANFYPGHEKGLKVIKACFQNFRNWIGGPSNILYRKKSVGHLLFDTKYSWVSDFKFNCQVLENWDYYNIDEPGYLYRRHNTSDTVKLSRENIQQKEEYQLSYELLGCYLGQVKYLKYNIGLLNKLKIILGIFSPKLIKDTIKLFLMIIYLKSWKTSILSSYFNCHFSYNSIYSNTDGIIMIGNGSSINDFTVIRIENGPLAGPETSALIIGENTYIGEMNNIRAAGGVIRIGNNVLISQMVTIVPSNHGTDKNFSIASQKWLRNTIIIEDDVWIGAGCTILAGSYISKGSIVAANSVVKGHFEPYSIVAGSPAKKIKERT